MGFLGGNSPGENLRRGRRPRTGSSAEGFSCAGQRENSVEHILGTEKKLLLLELEEHREGDIKGWRLGPSLVKDYLVLPGL